MPANLASPGIQTTIKDSASTASSSAGVGGGDIYFDPKSGRTVQVAPGQSGPADWVKLKPTSEPRWSPLGGTATYLPGREPQAYADPATGDSKWVRSGETPPAGWKPLALGPLSLPHAPAAHVGRGDIYFDPKSGRTVQVTPGELAPTDWVKLKPTTEPRFSPLGGTVTYLPGHEPQAYADPATGDTKWVRSGETPPAGWKPLVLGPLSLPQAPAVATEDDGLPLPNTRSLDEIRREGDALIRDNLDKMVTILDRSLAATPPNVVMDATVYMNPATGQKVYLPPGSLPPQGPPGTSWILTNRPTHDTIVYQDPVSLKTIERGPHDPEPTEPDATWVVFKWSPPRISDTVNEETDGYKKTRELADRLNAQMNKGSQTAPVTAGKTEVDLTGDLQTLLLRTADELWIDVSSGQARDRLPIFVASALKSFGTAAKDFGPNTVKSIEVAINGWSNMNSDQLAQLPGAIKDKYGDLKTFMKQYLDAAANDNKKFAAMTGDLTGAAAFQVVLGKATTEVGKAGLNKLGVGGDAAQAAAAETKIRPPAHDFIWTQPETLAEDVALKAAKSGKGEVLMRGPFGDPKFDGPNWVKKRYRVERTADGNTIDIHYMENTATGQTDQFKFVLEKGSHSKPNANLKEPSVSSGR